MPERSPPINWKMYSATITSSKARSSDRISVSRPEARNRAIRSGGSLRLAIDSSTRLGLATDAAVLLEGEGECREAALAGYAPAATYVEVAGLADPRFLVEIEGEAVKS